MKAIVANLSVSKSVEVYDPGGDGLYAIPGKDVIYTIEVINLGDEINLDTIEIIDPIPPELTLYRGAFDGTTTEPVKFIDGATPSGLNCCTSVHLSYSTDGVVYTYQPPADIYDATITHLKVTPSGIMSTSPAGPSFELKFRAQIK